MTYSAEEHEALGQDCLIDEYDFVPSYLLPPTNAEACTNAQKKFMVESFQSHLKNDARKLLGSERLFEKLFGPLSAI